MDFWLLKMIKVEYGIGPKVGTLYCFTRLESFQINNKHLTLSNGSSLTNMAPSLYTGLRLLLFDLRPLSLLFDLFLASKESVHIHIIYQYNYIILFWTSLSIRAGVVALVLLLRACGPATIRPS